MKDRLPAIDEKVLTFDAKDKALVINWRFNETKDCWRWQDWGGTSHWMPLPSAPQETEK